MKRLRPLAGLLLAMALCCLLPCVSGAEEPGRLRETTVLFTHDLHSHFLPQAAADGGESGGYARLKTALDRERARHPDALVLDGGDFSVGSLIQTLYTTQAAELRTMGAMGYDAATAGNHEFDHQGTGFARMLTAAINSGDRVPALLMANYKPDRNNPDQLDIQRAMAAYGVQDYMLLERGGVTYGIFGLMGVDSHACAPASGFALGDMADSAKRCVAALREQGAQFIICLSHSGTNEKQKLSEDEQLAKTVEGIDLIISGHTHTTLEQPIQVGDTYIVSAGAYCQNLGSITLRWDEDGERQLVDYRLISIDETLPEDREIARLVERWTGLVDMGYLSAYNMSCGQVLTSSDFDLPTPEYGVQAGNALGELVADAFLWASAELAGGQGAAVAVTADGVLRAPLYAGPITVSQAFDVLSLGVGADGTSGYPLVQVWLTGKELKAVAEVDASVTPVMPAAQLYMSGMAYAFNTHRLFFNRVMYVKLYQNTEWDEYSGTRKYTWIEDGQLYPVVTGMYSAQMLGTVKDKSMGLLSLEPKMADGSPVTDFNDCILRDKNRNEIKEWYALAAYLQTFGEDGVSDGYSQPDWRKEVSRSWNPIELVRNPNWITLAALLVIILAAALVVFLVRRLSGRRRGGGYRRRRLW